ncbi:MAG TPA: response regulator [Leptolyngbyaceae cyanobacterium M33_DOE_097]|nr:response regulator [Leptolyngbyaceae cyanobacterium M33_DOE_097]
MKTILVIDDDQNFRIIFSEWLEFQGFRPITANGGLEGVQLAQSHHPDLIFCDMNMPVLNGIDVLKQLQNDLNTSCIPFFFLTSDTSLQRNFVQQLGAHGILLKGAVVDELKQALNLLQLEEADLKH